ncbi:integrase arm-type DNA-binding domain-containing protein [Sphingomonas sediminicola]|uniref:Integrase arm-type DNA-binding domain-containing protein n=1 Tax=Sphingomonas sediminicola TaxID=386874 RepID=A0ABX6T883_9SPHN|nr:integrase arm-type DNA-binding domain-containing protein [Sphingomonas sediminicola]QNP46057.1 integrase arm-type DNA-binding domain-containing protein [Sphingomonas sediminicola]
MRLTKKDIERANKRRKYSDGRGLFLSVSAGGRKTWSFCYRFPDPSKDIVGPNGKPKKGYREREMSLGSIDFMDVDEARDRCVELRRMVRQGIDPMEERDRETRHVIRQQRDGSTFKDIAERYIDIKKAEWDAGGKSEQSWRGSLAKHVYPILGDMAVDRIDRADIIDLLLPIWTKVPVTATRLLPRLDLIFSFAIEEGFRSGNNPADRDSLRKSLPKASKVHSPKKHKAMTYAEVPAFVTSLRKQKGVTPQALEFLILTALRTSEVIGATWDEIDEEAGVWTIPRNA